MKIDFEKLSEKELIELNYRIDESKLEDRNAGNVIKIGKRK